jgi:hypothetical protein
MVLVASAGLHWATNGLSVLASATVRAVGYAVSRAR